MTRETITRILSAVVGLALIGAAIYLIAIQREEHVTTLFALGVAALGLAGVVLPSPIPPPKSDDKPKPPRTPPPGVGMMLMLAVAVVVAGCTDPIGTQARAAIVTGGVLSAGGVAVDAARGAALDRVEAQYPRDPEHDAQLEIEAARWRPVGLGLDAARSALLAWIDALELARSAGGGADLLAPIGVLAAHAVQLVAQALSLAASLGVTGLPEVPAPVLALASSVAGGQ